MKFNPTTGQLEPGGSAETDPLSLHLDQATPQTVDGGAPKFDDGIVIHGTESTGSNVEVIGGSISTDGDYTVVTYTSDGEFNVTGSLNVELLIVGGGGSGGGGYGGGGGGGGGRVVHGSTTISGDKVVTVGAGGAASSTTSNNGESSSFGSFVAEGGGGGGYTSSGSNGGSGGGASIGGAFTGGVGSGSGAGSLTGYGNNGGDSTATDGEYGGGGGGGASDSTGEVVDTVDNSYVGSGTVSDKRGMKFTASQNATITKVTKDSGVSATKAYILNDSAVELASASFSGDDAVFNYDVTASTTYYVVVDAEGSSYSQSWNSGVSFPITGTVASYLNGYFSGTDQAGYTIQIKNVTFSLPGGSGIGGTGSNSGAGAGGAGKSFSITGTPVVYGGGGGGGGLNGTGGEGGGGDGGYSANPSIGSAGSNGTDGLGGGGGGGHHAYSSSGAGGSGVVIVRYLTADAGSTVLTTHTNLIRGSTAQTEDAEYILPVALPASKKLLAVDQNGQMTTESETDPVFSASPASSIDAGDLVKLDNLSGTNSGDQVGDGVTIRGAGTLADPFVAVGGGSDTITRGFTVGNGTDLITVSSSGMVFLIVPWAGKIKRWDIATGDGASKTIQTTIKKNGTTIGQDIDLTAEPTNSGTGLSIDVAEGDVLSGWVDSNTDATKVVVQLLLEKN